MSEPVLIAVDAGGTAVKVVGFSLQGVEIAQRTADVRTDHYPDGRVERDPEAFWAGTVRAVRDVVEACEGATIQAVACTGFGNGIFLVDEKGHGTRPGIVSVDHRAEPIVQDLKRSGAADAISARTGHRVWGGQTLMQLTHLARFEAETMARTRWALSCKDFIRFRLTDTALTDPTDASGGGLMDIRAGTYAEAVFADLGITGVLEKLPPIVNSTTVAGRVSADAARDTGLPEGTPVAGSMMDVAACALGAGAVDIPVLTMIAGTWSISCIETMEPPTGEAPVLNMLYRDGASHLVADGSPASAANLSWYLDQAVGRQMDHQEANILVSQSAVRARRCRFLPYIFGPEPRRGAFIDLGPTDDLGTMLRAIFEGVAFQSRVHAEAAARLTGQNVPDAIRLAGGVTHSSVWAQIFSDICGRRIEITHTPEVGALGAAMCASVATGTHADLAEAANAMTRVAERCDPDPTLGAFYDEAFLEFQRSDQAMVALLAGRTPQIGETRTTHQQGEGHP